MNSVISKERSQHANPTSKQTHLPSRFFVSSLTPRNSHKYQQLPLIPVDEFLSQHPEHGDDGENGLMVARIEHERTEREALEQQRQELLKRKQKLIAENKRRKDDLANLDQDLEKFIDVRISQLSRISAYTTTS